MKKTTYKNLILLLKAGKCQRHYPISVHSLMLDMSSNENWVLPSTHFYSYP